MIDIYDFINLESVAQWEDRNDDGIPDECPSAAAFLRCDSVGDGTIEAPLVAGQDERPSDALLLR